MPELDLLTRLATTSAGTGQPTQANQNRAAKTGQPKHDSQNRTARTGQPKQASQNRTAKKRTAKKRITKLGQPEQDTQGRQDRTDRIGQTGQENNHEQVRKDMETKIVQPGLCVRAVRTVEGSKDSREQQGQ